MKMRKILGLLLSFLLIAAMFAGCGEKAMAPMENGAAMDSYYEPAQGGDMNYGVMDSLNRVDMEKPESNKAEGSTTSSTAGEGTITPQNQKLIRTIRLNAETEDMDVLLSQVEARINELGGYVEAREIYNGSMYNSKRYRSASLTIRIPAAKLDSFVNHVGEVSNITNNTETTQDVTLQYVAIESRIKALETEQETLLELMKKADNMSDLLTIESRLTDVRYELENISAQLRVYDNKVNYGTIHLSITEVVEYSEPEPENGWQRMANGFIKSAKGVGNGLKEFFIWLITAVPYLLLIGAIGFGIFMIIFCSVRRKQKRRAAQKKAEE